MPSQTTQFLTALGGAAALLLLPAAARADTITVSPPKFELGGNPGDTVTEIIKVRNDGADQANFRVEVEDFKAQGDDGSIDLVDSASNSNFSMAKWITVSPTQFAMSGGQEKQVGVSIRIPKSGEPGGHYASVLIRRTAQATLGGASVESRIGSLILMRVSGATKEQAALTNFSTDPFKQRGPVDFRVRFHNDGNVHVAPSGTVVITDLFGRKVKEIPVPATNVLPGADRELAARWEDVGLAGRYTASYVATYGQQRQTVSGSTSFIILPLWLMGLGAAVITVLYLMIAKRKKLKRFLNKLTSD